MIQNVFNECPQLIGVKVAEKYRIIEAELKKGWVIPTNESINVDKRVSKTSGVDYYLFYSVELTIDEVVDWLVEKVIKPNGENEIKQALLKTKVKELKEMFQSTPLDELQSLRFTSEEDTLKITPTESITLPKVDKTKVKKTVEGV